MSIAIVLKFLGITGIVAVVLFALSLFVLWTQISRYRHYWEENNLKPAVAGEILYVALGDSTAQGIGATQPDKGYPGLIRQQLMERKSKPVRLVNLSKSGAKVRDVIETQLPALQALNTDDQTIITIEIGANNMVNFDAQQFESDMNELMSQLPPQTIISDIPYFGGSRFKSKEPNVIRANEIMYRLADKHGFELVPLHDQIQRNGGFKTFAPDWFHPSNTAYRENWAPVFLERL
ncbi:MAG: SGNH/GDSL hydrolase family protein [Candidatus Saccharimonadales bacterium]